MQTSKHMYVVIESGGQFDDLWSDAICASDDEHKAHAYADKMNITFSSMSEKMREFYKTILPEWNKNNTVRQSTPTNKHNEPSRKFFKDQSEFTNAWIMENLTQEEQALVQKQDNNSWHVEKVPVL